MLTEITEENGKEWLALLSQSFVAPTFAEIPTLSGLGYLSIIFAHI